MCAKKAPYIKVNHTYNSMRRVNAENTPLERVVRLLLDSDLREKEKTGPMHTTVSFWLRKK